MGNLHDDTAVEGGDGRWTARFSDDWEIWGPNGGYVAAVALRAAGAHSSLPRPASLLCHYLGVAAFDEVQIETVSLRRAKRAESVRVSISQSGAPIAEVLVWCVADELDGLRHDVAVVPDVPRPSELRPVDELVGEHDPRPVHRFFSNFEQRPTSWRPYEEWAARDDLDPVSQSWLRFSPQATFDDPYSDAARSVVLLDTFQWPAAANGHRPGSLQHIAPSLDLAVFFHAEAPDSEWLLVDASSPIARDGLVGGRATVWSDAGQLLASGGQQMLCRPAPPM